MARKIEPRKISSCSTLCLLVVFTQQLEIIVTSLHKHQGIRLFFNGTTHVEHALPTITLFIMLLAHPVQRSRQCNFKSCLTLSTLKTIPCSAALT